MKRRSEPSGVFRVVAYARVSTEGQAESGAGLDAQLDAIDAAIATREGWSLVSNPFVDRAISGKRMDNRPGLKAAIELLDAGHADVLIVSKLDRLSRSMLDFAELLHRSNVEGWRMVILDLAVDTTTPSGEVMAHVAAAFAQFERRLIGQRTRDALAIKRAAGVRLGRPPVTEIDAVDRRIARERGAGQTLAAIADGLNADGIPTARDGRLRRRGGVRWYPSTVAAVLNSARLEAA